MILNQLYISNRLSNWVVVFVCVGMSMTMLSTTSVAMTMTVIMIVFYAISLENQGASDAVPTMQEQDAENIQR